MDTLERGKKIFEQYTSGSKKHLTEEVAAIAPDIEKYVMEFVFGEVYAREGLSSAEKVMATIVALATQGGCEDELTVHINNALNIGIEPKRIIDTFIQISPYTGFPRVVNAVLVAKHVFKERDVIY